MWHHDQFERELEVRRLGGFGAAFVVGALRSHDADADAGFRADLRRKGLAATPYCVVMDAGSRSLADVLVLSLSLSLSLSLFRALSLSLSLSLYLSLSVSVSVCLSVCLSLADVLVVSQSALSLSLCLSLCLSASFSLSSLSLCSPYQSISSFPPPSLSVSLAHTHFSTRAGR